MDFKLSFNVDVNDLKLSHKHRIVTIGSCFSNEMASKLVESGFYCEANTFGTLFHPMSILKVIEASIEDDQNVDYHQREDLHFSWDSAGEVFALKDLELKSKIINLRCKFKHELSTAKLLIVTFGTAWGYVHKELNSIVGNCHKASSNLFDKELFSINEMESEWIILIEKLKLFNPNLKILFTVSPVRHKKDGLIDNNRSKARLIELTHLLVEKTGSHYFPAYELLIDELRDYRFFGEDLVHPNKIAVDYIWNAFKLSSIDKVGQSIIDELLQLKQQINHKSLYADSVADKLRYEKAKKMKATFLENHPEVNWG